MKNFGKLILVAFLGVTTSKSVLAQNKEVYSLDKKIPLIGDGGFDYLAIDTIHNMLYVSHDTQVNIIDINQEKEIGQIKEMKGVHGIAFDYASNKGFISDGDANAVVAFDLTSYQKIATIPITGVGPDAIMFDAFSKKVYSFNGDSKNTSVIDASTLKQIGSIDLGGGPEFAVSDGMGKIYNNIEDQNSLATLDASSLKVISSFPLSPCGTPTGLAIDLKNNRLFTGCRKNKGLTVLDAKTGKIIQTLPIGAGVDAVAYDPRTGLLICSCGDGTTTIIKQQSADEYKVVQTLNTAYRARTLALDLKTHKLYLSVADMVKGTRKSIPGTFHVLVYKMI